MNQPSQERLAVYFTVIIVAMGLVSSWDYADARRRECAGKSNAKYLVTWDSQLDSCKKELRNGTS